MDRRANVAGEHAACRYPFLMERTASQHEPRPRIATIFLAAFLGGAAAAVGVNRFLDLRREAEHPTVECEPIFVAARGIAAGDPVTVWDVSLKDWPKATAPSDALRMDDSLEGQFAIRTVREGQPLLRSNIAREAARSDPAGREPAAVGPATVGEEQPFDLAAPPRPPERSTSRLVPEKVVSHESRPVDERRAEGITAAAETGFGVEDNGPVDSPTVDSPTVDSPTVDSPTVDSPVVDSPAVAVAATPTASNMVAAESGWGDGPTGRLWPNSPPHVMDDVPGVKRPQKPEVFLPGKSPGGLFPRPVGGAAAEPTDASEPVDGVGPVELKTAILGGLANTAETLPGTSSTVEPHSPERSESPDAPSRSAFAQPSEASAIVDGKGDGVESSAPDRPEAVRDGAASEEPLIAVSPGIESLEAGGDAADGRAEGMPSSAETAGPPVRSSPSPAESASAPGTPAPAAGDSAAGPTAPAGGDLQPPPLRFLVIPERIAALVDGPTEADAPIAADAPLRTIDSLGTLSPRARGGAPERSASTSLPGNPTVAPPRRTSEAAGSGFDGGGNTLPRQTATPRRQHSIHPDPSRGSMPPRQQPTTAPQQTGPGSRPLLRSLFPNVSAGMDRFGHEISERLRRAQE
jgi:hypothetical protein